MKDKGGNRQFLCYYFVNPDLWVEIIFRKERTAENGRIDFEIMDIDTSAHWILVLFLALLGEQNIVWIFSNLRLSTFWKNMMGCPER